MRIVVAGTHGSGKSTLINDFASRHREFTVLTDPYEELDDDRFGELDAALFAAQLDVAVRRLVDAPPSRPLIAERGPLDFLAYLTALDVLGRRGRSAAALRRGMETTREAASHIDLLVLLPLEASAPIAIAEEEDLDLRDAMNDALLELADEPDLAGARVVEITGSPRARLEQLEATVFPGK